MSLLVTSVLFSTFALPSVLYVWYRIVMNLIVYVLLLYLTMQQKEMQLRQAVTAENRNEFSKETK